MLSSVTNCLRKYLNFSGCSSRSEFWWLYVFTILVHAAAAIADGRIGENPWVDFPIATATHALRGVGAASLTSFAPFFSLVCSLILFPAMLSAGSRRMRDIGKPAALYVIPVSLSVAFFSVWWLQVGQYPPSLVYIYGEDWQVILFFGALPLQLAISVFCTWFLVKPSS